MRWPSALAALALVATPATAQIRCITTPEAEAMALVAMPDILHETGKLCASRLPARSLLRGDTTPLVARYQVEADRAWPTVQSAIVKLSDPMVDVLLQSQYARPMLTTLIVPLIVGRIAVEDCGTIDRLVTLLEPLPPRNTAGIVVVTLRYLKTEQAKGGKVAVPDLPLCQEQVR